MPVKNICDCDNPPGGQAVCEPHQMAVCLVLKGVARRECLSPPRTGNRLTLINWAWTQVDGVPRPSNAVIHSAQLGILKTGKLVRNDGAIVNFALPKSIVRAVTELELDRPRAKIPGERIPGRLILSARILTKAAQIAEQIESLQIQLADVLKGTEISSRTQGTQKLRVSSVGKWKSITPASKGKHRNR
jgi:hypothetical protein